MTDITARLRALASCEHDDTSIGDVAADEIDRLRAERDALTESVAEQRRTIECLMVGMPDDGATPVIRRIAALEAERDALLADANKSERRAITFGDLLHHNILAMRAAVVAGHLESPAHGLQWIVNTLTGPGHLPDLDEARALGGAQALFDKEVAEQDAFRAAHPGPAAIDAALEKP